MQVVKGGKGTVGGKVETDGTRWGGFCGERRGRST